MRTIHKYKLAMTDFQIIMMPINAKILSVQVQIDTLCIWAEVIDDVPLEGIEFYIIGTGHPIPNEPIEYIGTFQLNCGRLVFHLYKSETL